MRQQSGSLVFEQVTLSASLYVLSLGISLPLCSLLLVCACLALCIVCRTREHTVSHLTLNKDQHLKDHLVEVAGDTDRLDEEFKQLEQVVQNEVIERTAEANRTTEAHNRFNDIRKFSFNITRDT